MERSGQSSPDSSATNVPIQRARTLYDAVTAFGPPSAGIQALYDRVFAISVDGTPLGNLTMEFQGGDPDLHITFTEDFGNVVQSIYLLDAAGYRNFRIKTRPRSQPPDLELILDDGHEVYFEHTRAVATDDAQVTGMREQINVGLRVAMRDDPRIEAAIQNWYVSINMVNVPLDKSTRDDVVAEIVRFVKAADWSAMPHKAYLPFNAVTFPLLAQYDAECYIAPGTASLQVDEGGGTIDPYAPYTSVARSVVKKSKPGKYNVAPLWLGITTAAHIPVLPEALLDPRRVATFDINDTPFESIIVGSAMGARTYSKRCER